MVSSLYKCSGGASQIKGLIFEKCTFTLQSGKKMFCKSIISLQSDPSVFSISKENGEHENRVYKFSLPNSVCN